MEKQSTFSIVGTQVMQGNLFSREESFAPSVHLSTILTFLLISVGYLCHNLYLIQVEHHRREMLNFLSRNSFLMHESVTRSKPLFR